MNVHVSTVPYAQQSHSETKCNPGSRSDTDSSLLTNTAVVTPLQLCVDHPLFLPYPRDLLSQQGQRFTSDGKSYHLLAWSLSCNIIKQQDFRMRSVSLPLHLGDPQPIAHMTTDGFASLSFDTHGLSPQTVKGYRTCLGSVLIRMGKAKVVQHISDMTSSMELQRPRVTPVLPQWDLGIVLVGSLSAKKWEKCYFPDKSTKLTGMVGKGLRSNIFNGSKMAFHYFVFCAPFSNGSYLPCLKPF